MIHSDNHNSEIKLNPSDFKASASVTEIKFVTNEQLLKGAPFLEPTIPFLDNEEPNGEL